MRSARPVRFGILGAGMVAEYHRQAIAHGNSEDARLSCVAHYDASRFDEIAARFGVRCVDEEALLADRDVDAVCICTPSGQHAEQAIAAAQMGKHVLIEKPMAVSNADADRVIRACEDAGVTLGVVYQRRCDPVFQAVHRAVSSGALGTLTMGVLSLPYFRGQSYYDSAAWRGTWALDGGGVLMNQGIHIVDLLVWFMGDPVDVTARAGTVHHDVEVEDVLAATLRFADGAIATITATTTAQPGFPHRLELYGTTGGLQIEGEHVVRWDTVAVHAPAELKADAHSPKSAGSGGDPRGIAPIGHVRIIQDFVDAVLVGRPPVVDGPEGRRSLSVVLDVYRAAGLVLA